MSRPRLLSLALPALALTAELALPFAVKAKVTSQTVAFSTSAPICDSHDNSVTSELFNVSGTAAALTVIPLPAMTAGAVDVLALIQTPADLVATGETSRHKRLRAGTIQQMVLTNPIVSSNSMRLQFVLIPVELIVLSKPQTHPDYFYLNHALSFDANSTLVVGGYGGFMTTVVVIDSKRFGG